MLPSLGLEFARQIWPGAEKYFFPTSDLADVRQCDSCKLRWNTLARRNREKKFIILAPVQGQIEIDFTRWFFDSGTRNEGGVNLGSDAAFLAKMPQVGG